MKTSFLSSPFTRERLHDKITRYIALGILKGEIQDGQAGMASETDLCKHLNVSRTVLRESIKVLEAKGLVEVRSKIGMRIRPRSDWNLLDPDLLAWQHEAGVDDMFIRNLCEIRLIVETAAAELAASRATPENLAALDEHYRQMEASVENKQLYDAADIQFHNALFAACQNELLKQVGATIGMAIRGTQGLTSQVKGHVGLPHHKAVAVAIQKRDPKAAREAMEKLVLHAAGVIHKLLHPNHPKKWKKLMPMYKGHPGVH